MRENMRLYHGKRVDNGKWVEGYFFETNTPVYRAFIIMDMAVDITDGYTDILGFNIVEVDPETVGQYTGLTDKNGKMICEGDIVKYDGNYSIGYVNGVYRLFNESGFYSVSVHNYYSYLEVIGNIHDNPELLKGGGSND